jgi:UDP-N-acetyl-2-amino-2-deoxyglucuronate dehydrogenase
MSVGFGIVGTGVIAGFLAEAISHLEDARLVGCYDTDPERSRQFAAARGCTPFYDYDTFLGEDAIRTVLVCTPSGLHAEPAARALRARKDVIVEKPLEVTPERCDRLIAAADESGSLLGGVFQTRFSPAVQQVKRAVEQGRFGRLTIAHASVKWYRSQEYYDQAGWRGTWSLDGGGALMNQSIHAVDLLQWLVGEVVEVSAYTDTLAHERIEVEDVAVAAVRFGTGALGTIMGTTAAWPGWSKHIEISGTAGSVAIDDDRVVRWDFQDSRPEDEEILQRNAGDGTAKGAADPLSIDWHGHFKLLQNVIATYAGTEDLLVDGREARKAVAIIDAVYRSAREGRPLKPR